MNLPLIAYGVAAGAIVGGVLWFGHAQREYGRSEVRAAWDKERAAHSEAAASASAAALTETARRIAAQEEITREAQQRAASAALDAASAARAADGLRAQLREYTARSRAASSNPTATASCPSTAEAVSLLSEMLAESDDRAGIYAQAADESRNAGLACERSYDALTGEGSGAVSLVTSPQQP